MSRIAKKICPVTMSDEIIVTHPDPDELVITQRKTVEGKFERVLRPRKEVKRGLLPEVTCPSLGHPYLDAPSPLGTQLWKAGKAWCTKTKKSAQWNTLFKIYFDLRSELVLSTCFFLSQLFRKVSARSRPT